MQDKIIIKRLQVFCKHGVYEAEKQLGQNFYVSAELSIDTFDAGISDDISQSVNYAELCSNINDYMKNNTYNLIETVANNLAIHILEYSELINNVKLEISKPEAPIGLPLQDVYVEIERGWHTAYIAIGSNIGDSIMLINDAIGKILSHPAMRLIKQSDIITTKPYGNVEQPDFKNGCMQILTYLNPTKLLDELHIIENEAGRTRDIHWGPRTLDLDIIMYDEMIIHTEELIIPHIDMQNRMFVLEPLNQISPNAYHPILRKTVNELYNELNK